MRNTLGKAHYNFRRVATLYRGLARVPHRWNKPFGLTFLPVRCRESNPPHSGAGRPLVYFHIVALGIY